MAKDLAKLNSAQDDLCPIIAPEGNTLFLASDRRGGRGGMDVWMSQRVNTSWQAAEDLTAINSGADEFPGSFSISENALYFTRCAGPSRGCDIYVSYQRSGGWSEPVRLGPPVNTDANESSPAISSDGSLLVFASDREGGLGNFDLWFCRRKVQAGHVPDTVKAIQWKAVKNLGPGVNTAEWEGSAFLLPDGQTLYFSSRGRSGAGGADIFRSRYVAGEWYPAENAGSDINSPADDLYFSLAGAQDLGYFSADRKGGMGGADIYELALPIKFNKCNLVVVRGTVHEAATGSPLAASVAIKDPATGAVLAQGPSDPATGDFQLGVENDHTLLEVTAPGFAAAKEPISVPPHDNCAVVFKQVKLQKD